MAPKKEKMRRPFRLRLPSPVAILIYLLALRLAWEAHEEPGLLIIIFGVISITAFFAWISAYLRYRTLADIPIADIVSAPQGYVKFSGTACQATDTVMLSELKKRPCLWYHYREEVESEGKWETADKGESMEPFLLDDGTGLCMLDPQQAELDIGSHWEEWKAPGEGRRYTESYVLAGDAIYAIGEHITERSLGHDQANLLGPKIQSQGLHVMRPPADGRLFLISDTTPASDAEWKAKMAWVHLATLFLSLSYQGYLWLHLATPQ